MNGWKNFSLNRKSTPWSICGRGTALSGWCLRRPFTVGDPAGDSLLGLDGLLISTTLSTLNASYLLDTLKIPTVLFQGECEYNLPFHQVLPDQMTGLRTMFRTAKAWNFDGVLIVHHNHENACFRKNICIAAAEEAGYRNIETIPAAEYENVYKLGLRLVRKCRNKLIFTASDLITFDLIRAFSDMGLQPSRGLSCRRLRQHRRHQHPSPVPFRWPPRFTTTAKKPPSSPQSSCFPKFGIPPDTRTS